MEPDSLKDQIKALVDLAGSVAELARLSLVSERSIRNYLSGEIQPSGKVLERLTAGASQARQRRSIQGAAQPAASYGSVKLKTLSAAIFEIESRVPLLAPEVKAGLIAACYEHLVNAPESAAIGDFVDLITGAAATGRTLAKPLSDEELEDERDHKRRRK